MKKKVNVSPWDWNPSCGHWWSVEVGFAFVNGRLKAAWMLSEAQRKRLSKLWPNWRYIYVRDEQGVTLGRIDQQQMQEEGGKAWS